MTPTGLLDLTMRVMRAVDDDIAEGRVPSTVASFTELHEYVDANEYVDTIWPGCDPAAANFIETTVGGLLAYRTR